VQTGFKPIDTHLHLGICLGMSNASPSATPLPWLLRYRWAALVGYALSLAAVQRWLGSPVAWDHAWPVLLLMAVSNAAVQVLSRSRTASRDTRIAPSIVVGSLLALDAILLTLLLRASGGAGNPFTILYILQIVVAALLLDARWTTWITICAALCFAALFIPGWGLSQACIHDTAGAAYAEHLRGMWVAFALGGSAVAAVVHKLARVLSAQQRQIEQLRERALNAGHLAALTTLAAGAAHELRTPLGTIAIAANELKRRLRSQPQAETDVALIEAEVERCQEILFAMGPRFCEQSPAPKRLIVSEVLVRVCARFAETNPAAVSALQLALPEARYSVTCDEDELCAALQRLLENALEAAAPGGASVSVGTQVRTVDGQRQLALVVQDQGPGMAREVLDQATTPFFTTKDPGSGMGLGLFLVTTFCMSAGGSLELSSEPGRGTLAKLWLPLDPPDEPEPALLRLRQRFA
jgi:two-component system sensor histidine kinase RegB